MFLYLTEVHTLWALFRCYFLYANGSVV